MAHPGLSNSLLDWFPSSVALKTSTQVIRERLGLWVAR
jgi:hypothetical protein